MFTSLRSGSPSRGQIFVPPPGGHEDGKVLAAFVEWDLEVSVGSVKTAKIDGSTIDCGNCISVSNATFLFKRMYLVMASGISVGVVVLLGIKFRAISTVCCIEVSSARRRVALPKRPQPTITSASRTVKRSVETSPTPASSLESGTSFVGKTLNFEGPIPKDHLTEDADSQGESFETTRGLDSDPETEVDLRAAMSLVVPVMGQQFVVPSRHIKQPQRQAMEAVRKFISPPIF
ncbi:hypothetical protein OUZ56_030046 [Daphnia magna]|uniref:Transmembrane protein n=1 Tax=Daphnia magna TaxID=35525 RepID=A0ABQ9ZQT5_9CRUS|nr:hypothetical protein OUZ56_030046 [Daphnia magna]